MSVTPAMIATALGVAAPLAGSTQHDQWQMWISDAEMLIETRRATVSPDAALDPAKLDYVVRESVVAHVRHPDDSTMVDVSVDDGRVSRTYKSSQGRVQIRDDWWALLGLVPDGGRAYAVDTVGPGRSGHLPWCDPTFGGTDCSCGAIYTRHEYPLWEGGILSPDPVWWNLP